VSRRTKVEASCPLPDWLELGAEVWSIQLHSEPCLNRLPIRPNIGRNNGELLEVLASCGDRRPGIQ
jgi:hypothetical protein